MSILSKLTIVIPTYNRYKYLLRSMSYWSGKGMTVLVLDGTTDPVEKEFLSHLASNIHYHHHPIPVLDRLKIAVNLVNTEYSVLLGDDEFFLPSGLLACINTIESEGLVSCLGRSLFFFIKEGNLIAEPLNHEAGSPWHPGFRDYKIFNNDPAIRVKNHMNPYLSTGCFSVTKTDVWKINLLALAQSQNNAPSSSEIAFELCMAYQGKSRVINSLTWFRGGELPNQLAGTSYLEFNEWYEDPNYKEEVHSYIDNVVNALLPVSKGHTKTEIYKIIQSGCTAFSLFERTRRFDPRAWIVNMHLGFKPMYYLIIKRYNQLMQKIGVNKSEEYGLKNSNPDLLDMARVWSKNGIGVDLKEVQEINDLLIKFHSQPK
jgi:glycosyltransferase domain-containing protein